MSGWKNTADIGLYQYRGRGWPLLGDFAVGLLAQDPANVDWRFDVQTTESTIEIDVQTPLGGYFAWFRGW